MVQEGVSETMQGEPESWFRRSGVAVMNGATIGFLEVLWWISLLSLIFAGPLSVFVGRASVFMFVGVIISSTIIAFRSSWRGSISMPQDVPVAILVVTTSRLAAAASSSIAPDDLFITIIVTIGLGSIAFGLFMTFLGWFKLGNLVRFLPFPVMAGFLGGTGWLLLVGGMASSLESGRTADILRPESIIFWVPAVVVALLVYFAGRYSDRPILLPAVLLLSTVVFYIITSVMGLSIAELTQAGWLVGALPDGYQPQLPNLADFANVQWNLILAESGSIAILAVASAIAMLLNNSGFELAINADFDPNKDLRTHGIANVLGGLVGGWPSYITPAWSSLNAKDKKEHPLSGFIAPIVTGILLFYATQLFTYLPRFVMGATVAYIGIIFLAEWVIEPARRLPRLEYAIVLLILAVIAFFGLLEGVAVGLILAVILFVVNYSQIDVLRYVMSGLFQQSRVTRVAQQRDYLRSVGEEVQILQLQGYIFFGSANRLLDTVRELANEQEIRYLILDFDRVSGIDSTALLSFSKMQQYLAAREIELFLCDLLPNDQKMIEQELSSELVEEIEIFKNVDLALQVAEDAQLVRAGYDPTTPVPSFKEQVKQALPNATNIDELLELLEVKELKDGEYLMHAGDAATDMFFVKEGTVTAQLERDDGKIIRLETMSMGRSVGELGFYLNQSRTAAVVSQGNSVVYRLTKDNLAKIEKEHPDVASTIHRLIVNLLSDRVTHLVGVVDVLQQ